MLIKPIIILESDFLTNGSFVCTKKKSRKKNKNQSQMISYALPNFNEHVENYANPSDSATCCFNLDSSRTIFTQRRLFKLLSL